MYRYVFIMYCYVLDSLGNVETAIEAALTSAGYTVDISTISSPTAPTQVHTHLLLIYWSHRAELNREIAIDQPNKIVGDPVHELFRE